MNQAREPLTKEPGPAWTRVEFEAQLRSMERFYHIHHEFHERMDRGELSPRAIRGWVANRFYYQVSIPLKDANILANCSDREVRRRWVQRVLDHDGHEGQAGGIEAWLRLGTAVGLSREEMLSHVHVLPGVRFAVDAYVHFARSARWQEAAVSSLTEFFAPSAHRRRLAQWPVHYPWIDAAGYDYFRQRLSEAKRDVEHGMAIALEEFPTRQGQERVIEIIKFKLDVLWTMLDAMWLAYVEGRPPYFRATNPSPASFVGCPDHELPSPASPTRGASSLQKRSGCTSSLATLLQAAPPRRLSKDES